MGAVLAFLSYYVYQNRAAFAELVHYSPASALIIFLLYGFYFSLNAMVLSNTLRDYAVPHDLSGVTRISIISSLLNYLGPLKLGGTGYKSFMLHRQYGVTAANVLGCLLIAIFFCLLVNFIAGGLLLALLDNTARLRSLAWTLFACGIGMLAAALIWVSPAQTVIFPARLRRLIQGFVQLTSAMAVFRYVALFVAQLGMGTLITYVLFIGAGEQVDMARCALLCSASSLVLLVAITPGNVGTREVFYLLLGQVLQVDGPVMVMISIVDRCIQFLFVALCSLLLSLVIKSPFSITGTAALLKKDVE